MLTREQAVKKLANKLIAMMDGANCYLVKDYKEIRALEATALRSLDGGVEGYAATVPDHCDRIVWKGRYYHLPLDGVVVPREHLDNLRRGIERGLAAAQRRSDSSSNAIDMFQHLLNNYTEMLAASPNATQAGKIPRLPIVMEDLDDDSKRILYRNLWKLYDGCDPNATQAPINARAEEMFYKGRESILRKNASGCCCKIEEDGEAITSPCAAHVAWAESRLREVAEKVREACAKEAEAAFDAYDGGTQCARGVASSIRALDIDAIIKG